MNTEDQSPQKDQIDFNAPAREGWMLYHSWLSPEARMVRSVLHEYKITFSMRIVKLWERDPQFLALNPAGTIPVLSIAPGIALSGGVIICEYLDELHDQSHSLIGSDPLLRAESRRLCYWFHHKFQTEVIAKIVDEKIYKRFLGMGQPDSAVLRSGARSLSMHLDYITWILKQRDWLAGNRSTLADIAASSALSCLDYLNDIAWEDYPEVKAWYARIKSRPSFNPLLKDYIPGAPPPPHYADLDF